MDCPINERERAPEPAPLSDAYHKARRQYGLFSGLLLAWELIGIRLSGEPLTSFKVTFKSPEAAPFVLIVLILYFAYRLTVEWRQCEAPRREKTVSQVDFLISHVIGLVAIALFAVQRVRGVQVFDALNVNAPLSLFILCSFPSFFLGAFIEQVMRRPHSRRAWVILGLTLIFLGFWAISPIAVFRRSIGQFGVLTLAAWTVAGVSVGAVIGFLYLRFMALRYQRRS